ncbi:MAG: diguanylate cyclase [Pseudothermotoga sp.]|nr:diguanylate cyclase [Pseudothermotoga sp.]
MKGSFERVLRQGDLTAKFGEDEFVVLMCDCDEKYVYRLTERMIKAVEEPIELVLENK